MREARAHYPDRYELLRRGSKRGNLSLSNIKIQLEGLNKYLLFEREIANYLSKHLVYQREKHVLIILTDMGSYAEDLREVRAK